MQVGCHLYFCDFIKRLWIFHDLTPIVLLEKIYTISRHFSKKPSENQFLKKMKIAEKNVQVGSSLSVTTFSGLKLMKLLGFCEFFYVLATDPTPKHEI